MLDITRTDLVLGIVGTGLMGRGIAQIAVQGGIRVVLHDARPGAAGEARDAIGQDARNARREGPHRRSGRRCGDRAHRHRRNR